MVRSVHFVDCCQPPSELHLTTLQQSCLSASHAGFESSHRCIVHSIIAGELAEKVIPPKLEVLVLSSTLQGSEMYGVFVGDSVGVQLGRGVGRSVGTCVGLRVGGLVGNRVGARVGTRVGVRVGVRVGASVGERVGLRVGGGLQA